MAYGDKARAIRAAVEADPARRNVDIARDLGCLPQEISSWRRRNGMLRRTYTPSLVAFSRMNAEWLGETAAADGLSVADLVDAIVTDARLDGDAQKEPGA